jgi:hydrogenase maturation protein HypF
VGYAHVLGLDIDNLPFLRTIDKQSIQTTTQQVNANLNPALSSSMACLFDAVASLIGVQNEATYESQAAIEMEVLAKPFVSSAVPYPYSIVTVENGKIIHLVELLSAVIGDVRGGEAMGLIAARFHRTVAEMALDVCRQARWSTGLNEVALSGCLWQNQTLLDLVRDGLRRDGFVVYFHFQVPANDGGLALGQAVVANHLLGKREFAADRTDNRPTDPSGIK